MPKRTMWAVAFLVAAALGSEGRATDDELQKHLDALAGASEMGRSMCIKVRNIGMHLSNMGDAPIQPLMKLLTHEQRATRWAAAIVLAMIGPEAKAALPALEKTFGNKEEEIEIRIRAARAIASIKGTNPRALYGAIPDLEKKLVEDTRQLNKRMQSEKLWADYLAGKLGERWFPYRVNTKELDRARVWYDLATGRNLKEANQWLRNALASGKDYGGRFVVWSFGKNARQHPGRLEPDVEKAMKEKLFEWIEQGGGPRLGQGQAVVPAETNPCVQGIVRAVHPQLAHPVRR